MNPTIPRPVKRTSISRRLTVLARIAKDTVLPHRSGLSEDQTRQQVTTDATPANRNNELHKAFLEQKSAARKAA